MGLRTLLFVCISLVCNFLYAQEVEIALDLTGKKPSYNTVDGVSVHLSVQAVSGNNLLKLYDADPFKKPVIQAEKELDEEFEHTMGQYLASIGITSDEESDNKITLKVSMCALNYLLDKGWTATVKIELKVFTRNHELFSKNLSGYSEAGGRESEYEFAEQAINDALFNVFDGVNWGELDDSFSRDVSFQADHRESPAASGNIKAAPLDFNKALHTGRYHALIIAIDDYQYINKLDKPIKDASKLVELLHEDYSYASEDIIFLQNPTREEIINKLDQLVHVVGEEDNLLIFYAGHGYWDEQRETGYWLPVDAKMSSTANWLRNSTLQEYIGDIKSRHTLLIADACFGGGIFKTRKAFANAPTSINHMYELNSRKAITSGMLNEVPDKSVFFEYLVKRLELNEEKYLSSMQLFTSFRIAVMNNSDNVPQYGTIQKAGDEGGDFIFVRSGE